MEAEHRNEDDDLRRENVQLRAQVDQLRAEVAALTAERVEARGAHDDRLTGLGRREVLVDRLEHCMLRSERTSEEFAVLYCDLDGFKLVNDLFGHEAGDAVLVEVAARLRHVVRPYDTVTRFGGDEFVILLEDIEDEDAAVNIATRIVDAVASRIVVPDAEATIGISVGVAIGPDGSIAPDAYLARADAAMYEAKHAGKGRVELFGRDLDVRLTDRRELGNDLRSAVDRGEFELWYRPVASLDTGHITSVESTVRWNHPTRGLLEPDTFIPIALATGVIEQLDEWVLTTAATDVSQLRREHPDLVAWITVSSRLLMRDNGARRMLSILERAGADACSVGIEVGEASVVHDFASTVAALRELHEGNVCVALDNFCGQLTVPQLHTLRPDAVKLDRNLVTLLGVAVQSATAIRSITGMLRPLGITVAAKGVNSREQLAALISLNCDAAQGALIGPPARVADLVFELEVFSEAQPR